jgi:hypothetical protein
VSIGGLDYKGVLCLVVSGLCCIYAISAARIQHRV